jgi:hypothetical protein
LFGENPLKSKKQGVFQGFIRIEGTWSVCAGVLPTEGIYIKNYLEGQEK